MLTCPEGKTGGIGAANRVPNRTLRPKARTCPRFATTIPIFSPARCGVDWDVANRNFHVHLVSDSTGETVSSVARACLVQYEGVFVQEHVWSLVRTRGQMEKVMQAVERDRGPVLYTLVDPELRDCVRDHCRRLQLPCVGVLDQVMSVLAVHFHSKSEQWPGRQHQLDDGYFDRIDAMHYTLAHDDGQSAHDLDDADVILVGPSRTSKTPTCVYLANRGVRAANVPLVPSVPPPPELEAATRPLVVGLITDPERLVQIRMNRLRLLQQDTESEYTDMEGVQREIQEARRLYARRKWATIDVTRRSIEETAASILQMLTVRREQRMQAGEASTG
jgi:regulator of PEP synthase PpsR (kinase-PPPase family)